MLEAGSRGFVVIYQLFFPGGRVAGRRSESRLVLCSQSFPVAQLCVTCRLPRTLLLSVYHRIVYRLYVQLTEFRWVSIHWQALVIYYAIYRVYSNVLSQINHEVPRTCRRRDEHRQRCTPFCWYIEFCVQAAKATASFFGLGSHLLTQLQFNAKLPDLSSVCIRVIVEQWLKVTVLQYGTSIGRKKKEYNKCFISGSVFLLIFQSNHRYTRIVSSQVFNC